jgi:hypothetical protein
MESAKIKAEYMVRIMSHIGIDAVNIGEKDLALGVPYLKELQAKWNFPFVSANLLDQSGAAIFPRYVIKEVAGRKVGIFGLISDASEMVDAVKQITKGSVKIEDPLEAASAVIAELSGKADYVIALAHQKSTYDWRLARRVEGINLIVGGQDLLKTENPKKAGETLMVQAGEKGQYQGFLEIAPGQESEATNRLIKYNDEIGDDPEVKTLIAEYNEKLVELYSGPKESSASDSAAVQLHAAMCEPCHTEPYNQWKATDHAKAYQTLVDRSKQFDPSCLVCHTTRFEQPGGFAMKAQQKELVNVQCESCHGDAKEHLASLTPVPAVKPPVSTCTKCHTEDRCPGFEQDYDTYWQKIVH